MTWLGLGVGLGSRVTHGLAAAAAPVVGHIRTIRAVSCARSTERGEACA